MTSTSDIRCVLLDIEGTTTPIAFVHEVLFPYARSRVQEYLEKSLNAPETVADLAQLRAEHALDVERGANPPAQTTAPADTEMRSLVSYVQWLIDRDQKSPGLKSLQGRIWRQGYLDGTLEAPLFPDVLPALKRWRRAGLKIAIFSSGSTLAQKLLFGHTDAGDVTQYIDDYFDTTVGPKTATESYKRITSKLGLLPEEILFISDIAAELDAARDGGVQTVLCVRPGNRPQPDTSNHPSVPSFDEIA
jgi:enolase-phosphatase E1